MRLLVITFLLQGLILVSTAQPDLAYLPGPTHTARSRSLIGTLHRQLRDDMKRNEVQNHWTLARVYKDRTKDLVTMVKDSAFIDNPKINQLLDVTFRRLLESNEGLSIIRPTLLAIRNPFPNAACIGEGTFFVTTELLATIQNQSQLAAVLAHELAHYTLNHMRDVLIQVDRGQEIIRQGTLQSLGTQTISVQTYITLRNQLYAMSRYGRKTEQEADSLGFVYFRNAGFRQDEFIGMLSILDPGDSVEVTTDEGLFNPLRFARYPFDDKWLAGRARIYRTPVSDLFSPADSMRTHPELNFRKRMIRPFIKEGGANNLVSEELIETCRWIALVESTHVSFEKRRMDAALYEALIGLQEHPDNLFMITTTGRILVKLAVAKSDNLLRYYLPNRTAGYNARMRMVNNLIHNLTGKELAELGFLFVNNSSNFRTDVEEHYFLLWQLCELSGRKEVKKRVAAEYRAKYPKGIYKNKLK